VTATSIVCFLPFLPNNGSILIRSGRTGTGLPGSGDIAAPLLRRPRLFLGCALLGRSPSFLGRALLRRPGLFLTCALLGRSRSFLGRALLHPARLFLSCALLGRSPSLLGRALLHPARLFLSCALLGRSPSLLGRALLHPARLFLSCALLRGPGRGRLLRRPLLGGSRVLLRIGLCVGDRHTAGRNKVSKQKADRRDKSEGASRTK
jgi:hypothetical protein